MYMITYVVPLPHLVSVHGERPVVGLLQQRGAVPVAPGLAVVAGPQDALVVVDGAGVHSSRGLNQVPGYITRTRAGNESSRSSMFHNQASARAQTRSVDHSVPKCGSETLK